jgi:hypothetical protein
MAAAGAPAGDVSAASRGAASGGLVPEYSVTVADTAGGRDQGGASALQQNGSLEPSKVPATAAAAAAVAAAGTGSMSQPGGNGSSSGNGGGRGSLAAGWAAPGVFVVHACTSTTYPSFVMDGWVAGTEFYRWAAARGTMSVTASVAINS